MAPAKPWLNHFSRDNYTLFNHSLGLTFLQNQILMFDNIIAYSVKNKFVVGLFVAALIVWGLFSLKQLPIDAVPDITCLLYTSPSPRDQRGSRMPSSA